VEQLEVALDAAAEGRLGERDRRRAAELAHQVLGSAGTFGYQRASDLAGSLEQLLRTPHLADAERYRRARATLAALRSELAGADRPAEG